MKESTFRYFKAIGILAGAIAALVTTIAALDQFGLIQISQHKTTSPPIESTTPSTRSANKVAPNPDETLAVKLRSLEISTHERKALDFYEAILYIDGEIAASSQRRSSSGIPWGEMTLAEQYPPVTLSFRAREGEHNFRIVFTYLRGRPDDVCTGKFRVSKAAVSYEFVRTSEVSNQRLACEIRKK